MPSAALMVTRAVFKAVYAGFDKFINDFTIGQSRIHTLEKFRSR